MESACGNGGLTFKELFRTAHMNDGIFISQQLYYNAALVIISIPAIIIFAFAQKYIVSGITSGALKE
jgi:ABC-type maltose transport system permease subunit